LVTIGIMSKTSEKRRVKKKARNLLDMVPIRNPEYPFFMHSTEPAEKDRDEDTSKSAPHDRSAQILITIAVPRFRGKLGSGFMTVFGIKPNINVNLDAYGSSVFRKIDGKVSVREIGLDLRAEFGCKMDPLYGRLTHFLAILEKNELLSFLPKKFDKYPPAKK